MQTAPFTIGAEVACTDGPCGHLRRVIVDPVARAVTHLAVEPKHVEDLARLVPLDLVDVADAGSAEIRLRCTLDEFGRLDPAEETQFLPGQLSDPAYSAGQVLSWPYYGLGPGLAGVGPEIAPQGVVYETVPLGEVDVRHGEHVQATDGSIGRVQGLVVEQGSHHVTHVLLQEGHLWGRKDVAIPIRAVTSVDSDGIHLSLSKQEIQDLPPVDIDHPEVDGGQGEAQPGSGSA